jgi:peptidoglycan/LPS O-acetylase OafA/YrhL
MGILLATRQKIENFQVVDLVRSFAIMTVMAFHLKPTLPLPPPLFRWAWDHFQRNGDYGVCAFFVVSGFLITRVIDLGKGRLFHPDRRAFYARRIGRIIPLFLFALLLGISLVLLFQDSSSKKFNYCLKLPDNPFDPLFWLSLLTFTANWVGRAAWGGIGIHWVLFWSLAVEEQFYLLYPLVLGRLKSRENLIRLLAAIVLWGLVWRGGLYLLGRDNIGLSMRASFGAFDQIAMGALLYLVYKQNHVFFSKNVKMSAGIMITGFFLGALVYLCTFPVGSGVDRIYGPTLLAAGFFLFLLGGLHLPFFESKYLKLFSLPGKYSYGNYLFHITVLFFIHSYLWNLNIVVAFAFFVAVTSGVSAFSYHFFEMPANRQIRKLVRTKSTALN